MSAPEVAENYHDLPERCVWIGTCHGRAYPMQPAAFRHIVKHGFE
jgi:hypothetical protein